MHVLRNLDQLSDDFRGGALTIGNFDGVHRGHARIVERMTARARQLGGPAVVFTFDPHPAKLLAPDRAPTPLCWTERKLDLLCGLGVDAVVLYPTTSEFLHLSAREFFDQIVRHRLDAKAIVEGQNFFFGHNREGNVQRLAEFCRATGIELEVVEPIRLDDQVVSSSRIRRLVAEGKVELAAAMLTEPYRIRGAVVHGAGRGNRLGYPTANIDQIDTLLPGEGIYAGRLWLGESPWPAAVSLGPNPTFDEGRLKIEAYLIDYEGSLYGQRVELDFLARLRDIVRFDSVDDLIAQMDRDVATVRNMCA